MWESRFQVELLTTYSNLFAGFLSLHQINSYVCQRTRLISIVAKALGNDRKLLGKILLNSTRIEESEDQKMKLSFKYLGILLQRPASETVSNSSEPTESDTVSNLSETTESNKNETENSIHSLPSKTMIITYDIGLFLNTCVDDQTRYNILKNHWNPGIISMFTFYSIMFDETTDMSHTSQLCLVIRYVYNNSIHEDFITFIDPHKENFDALNTEPKLSDEVLGRTVLKIMKKHGLV
ncbi:hypothetical protein QTP88_005311 [Uroleucon formosanum]